MPLIPQLSKSQLSQFQGEIGSCVTGWAFKLHDEEVLEKSTLCNSVPGFADSLGDRFKSVIPRSFMNMR